MIQLFHPVPSLATVAVALLFLPLVAGGLPPLREGALLAICLTLQQFAISAHNDWCDRDLDAIAKPSRPIPAGQIAPGVVVRCALILAAVSLALAAPLGWDEVVLVALALVSGFAYNARLKRTAFSWLPFSIAFPLIPLFAAAAIDVWPTWWPAVAIAAQPLIVAIHLADSIPDIKADSTAGARGLASRLGPRRALRLRNAGLLVSGVALAALALVPRP